VYTVYIKRRKNKVEMLFRSDKKTNWKISSQVKLEFSN